MELSPKLIYIANESLLHHVDWPKVTESEWRYCGVSAGLDKALLHYHIEQHFVGEVQLVLAFGRNDSGFIETCDLIQFVATHIDDHDFVIWDKRFHHVAQFGHIGVFRLGINSRPFAQ